MSSSGSWEIEYTIIDLLCVILQQNIDITMNEQHRRSLYAAMCDGRSVIYASWTSHIKRRNIIHHPTITYLHSSIMMHIIQTSNILQFNFIFITISKHVATPPSPPHTATLHVYIQTKTDTHDSLHAVAQLGHVTGSCQSSWTWHLPILPFVSEEVPVRPGHMWQRHRAHQRNWAIALVSTGGHVQI